MPGLDIDWEVVGRNGFCLADEDALCSTEGDLRASAGGAAADDDIAGALLIGICLTGMGMLPSGLSLSVLMWRGASLELCPLLKFEEGLEEWENVDCMGL